MQNQMTREATETIIMREGSTVIRPTNLHTPPLRKRPGEVVPGHDDPFHVFSQNSPSASQIDAASKTGIWQDPSASSTGKWQDPGSSATGKTAVNSDFIRSGDFRNFVGDLTSRLDKLDQRLSAAGI